MSSHPRVSACSIAACELSSIAVLQILFSASLSALPSASALSLAVDARAPLFLIAFALSKLLVGPVYALAPLLALLIAKAAPSLKQARHMSVPLCAPLCPPAGRLDRNAFPPIRRAPAIADAAHRTADRQVVRCDVL